MVSTTEAVARPEDVGIDSEKLQALFDRAKRDVDQGILPGCQVAVARQGKLAGFQSFGSAVQGGNEAPVTAETLFHFFSSTKAVVAAAVWLLFEDGLLRLDERVSAIIPEFGTNGKDAIDVETMKMKRLIDKRGQMFDMLRQIIDKYNQTAKGIIESIGR